MYIYIRFFGGYTIWAHGVVVGFAVEQRVGPRRYLATSRAWQRAEGRGPGTQLQLVGPRHSSISGTPGPFGQLRQVGPLLFNHSPCPSGFHEILELEILGQSLQIHQPVWLLKSCIRGMLADGCKQASTLGHGRDPLRV